MKKIMTFLMGLIFASSIFATTSSPVSIIRNVANQLTQQLRSHKVILKTPKGDRFIQRLVGKLVVPVINTYRMAGSVVGRNYWNKATQSQRNRFIIQFKRQVVSTYSAALASYNDDKVIVYPLRNPNMWKRSNVVRVKSEIVRKNGQRIPITYDMSKTSKGWKIYDFSVENVSITESYRSQFASTLAQGGLNNLISKLKVHNRKVGV